MDCKDDQLNTCTYYTQMSNEILVNTIKIKTRLPMKNGKKSAHERNRTFTSLRMADFESAASTNSATWAKN